MTTIAARVAPGGFVGSIRKPSDIRGLLFHMAEGRNTDWYLSEEAAIARGKAAQKAGRNPSGAPIGPSRNVSVQYVIAESGLIVPMVPELRTAGSMNPAALRTDDGPYYGRSHLDAVLGTAGARNANKHVIAVEIDGTAKAGPNAKQVASMVWLFRNCRKRYRLRPLGHRDQQDVKPCPGGSKGMRAAFAAMGGHGKDWRPPKPVPPVVVPPPEGASCAEALVDAQARIAELEDQVEAMSAAIAAAIGTLDDFVEEP